ncbi:hypothetical protein [Roseivirga pacifica]|uniref:hypothetical protein n=1 Tax=Roseivirga pacifica TaxID=1267423 RepID=UPI003BAF707B
MTTEEYKEELINISSANEETNFVQKHFFNGTPFVFKDRDGDYYDFSKRIADNFQIQYSDINIVGSSRFGFSPYKFTEFSYESDIDVTLCNEALFEKFFDLVSDYTYKLRYKEIFLRIDQYKSYVKFIKYFSTGWMRPDLLPSNSTEFKEIRQDWDDFFKTISYGNSEVGNYKVKAGLFKNQKYAEKYYRSSISQIKKIIAP